MQKFTLFVSSPGDAAVERGRIERVVGRLNGKYANAVRITTIRWEEKHYTADTTFQEQIVSAADCNLVIAVFRARLGTPLPPEFARMSDGSPYPSGSAFEVLTAIEAAREHRVPDVYVFRRPEAPSVALDDPSRNEIESEWRRLKSFFERWFLVDGSFKAAFNTYSTPDDFEGQLERLLTDWLARKVAGWSALLWPPSEGSPFRGLAAFGAKHSAVFFGRSREIERAIDLWLDAADRGHPSLLVTGLSGAGKSSLARAGLVPRLTTPGVVPGIDLWRVIAMRPGEKPLATLATRLFDGPGDIPEEDRSRPFALPELAEGDARTPSEIEAVLARADVVATRTVLRALDRAAEADRVRQRAEKLPTARLLVLVDQLDELFGPQVSAEERRAFADLLTALVETGRVYLAMTLRAESTASFLRDPALRRLKEVGAELVLGPPGPAELAEIVRQPAEAAGLIYERSRETGERLDDRLLADADRADMLPLLQLALEKLHAGRITEGDKTLLPWAAYGSGLSGLIDMEAEAALKNLPDADVNLPRLLRRLVELDPDEGVTIRSVPLADLAADPAMQTLIASLVDRRILLSDRDGIRVSHQRVVSDWKRAASIVSENAEFFRVRGEVLERERQWRAANRDPDLLIGRGAPLVAAEALVQRFADELGAETIGFVRQSSAKARRGQRLVAAAAAVFAFLAIASAATGFFAYQQWQGARQRGIELQAALTEAETQRTQAQVAQSRQIAALAERVQNEGDAGTALALALEGAPETERPRPAVAEIEHRLRSALDDLREIRMLGHHSWVTPSIEFSPDGRTILTGSWDWHARTFDAATGEPIGTFRQDGAVNRARFIGEGHFFVTSSSDATARIVETATMREVHALRGHQQELATAVPTRDGRFVATSDGVGVARLWDIATGQPIADLTGHRAPINQLLFSPNSQLLFTGSTYHEGTQASERRQVDRRILVRNVERPNEIIAAIENESGFFNFSFSEDGRYFLVVSSDGVLHFHDGANGRRFRTLNVGPDAARSARFLANTDRILTVLFREVAVWSVTSGTLLARFEDFSANILSLAIDETGTRIALGLEDGRILVRDLETNRPDVVLSRHGSPVQTLAFSRDGARLASASGHPFDLRDVSVRLWRLAPSTAGTGSLTIPGLALKPLALSGDGRFAAIALDQQAGRDTSLRLVAREGAELALLARRGETVETHVPSDHRHIALSQASGYAVFNPANGDLISRLSLPQGEWTKRTALSGTTLVRATEAAGAEPGANAIGQIRRLRFQDVADSNRAATIRIDSEVKQVALDREGTRAAVLSEDAPEESRLRIYDTRLATELRNHRLDHSDTYSEQLVWAEGLTSFVVTSRTGFVVVPVDPNQPVRNFPFAIASPARVNFVADGRIAILSGDTELNAVDLATGEGAYKVAAAPARFVQALFVDDRSAFVSARGRLIAVHDAVTGAVTRTLDVPGDSNLSLSLVAATPLHAVVTDDTKRMLIALETGASVVLSDLPHTTASRPRIEAFSPDGLSLLYSDSSHQPFVRDLASGADQFVGRQGHSVESGEWVAEGASLLLREAVTPAIDSPDRTVMLVDLMRPAVIGHYPPPVDLGAERPLAQFLGNGRLLIVWGTEMRALVDPQTGTVIEPAAAPPQDSTPSYSREILALSPDGRHAVVLEFSTGVNLVALGSGERLARLAPDWDSARFAAFSPDGSHVLLRRNLWDTGPDNPVLVVDAQTGAPVWSLDRPHGSSQHYGFAELSGPYLALSHESEPGSVPVGRPTIGARILNIADGIPVHELPPGAEDVIHIAFSPSRAHFAVLGRRTISLRTMEGGRQLRQVSLATRSDERHIVRTFDDNTDRALRAYFINEDRLAILTTRGRQHIYDLPSGALVGDTKLPETAVTGPPLISGNGTMWAIEGRDGDAFFRRLPPDMAATVRQACRAMPRALSLQQRETALLGPAPAQPPCGRPTWDDARMPGRRGN